MSPDAVRMAVPTRLPWIRRQRHKFQRQEPQTERWVVSGETHFVLGCACRLRFDECDGRPGLRVGASGHLVMTVRPRTDGSARARMVESWQRARSKQSAKPLIERCSDALAVPQPSWGVHKMKTSWGSCNPSANRIWLNLDLATQPPHSIDCVRRSSEHTTRNGWGALPPSRRW